MHHGPTRARCAQAGLTLALLAALILGACSRTAVVESDAAPSVEGDLAGAPSDGAWNEGRPRPPRAAEEGRRPGRPRGPTPPGRTPEPFDAGRPTAPFDAGHDAGEAQPTDAGCARPSRDEVRSVMSGLADRVEACAQSDRAWTAVVDVYFAPQDGRVLEAAVAGAPSLAEAECVVDAVSHAVLAPFCALRDEYPVRYPYRVPAVLDADAGSDDESGDDDAGAGEATGILRIDTRPWSNVYIEGELIGATPQLAIELPAGSHVVTLVNDDFGITRVLRVTIVAGEVTTLVSSLLEEL